LIKIKIQNIIKYGILKSEQTNYNP